MADYVNLDELAAGRPTIDDGTGASYVWRGHQHLGVLTQSDRELEAMAFYGDRMPNPVRVAGQIMETAAASSSYTNPWSIGYSPTRHFFVEEVAQKINELAVQSRDIIARGMDLTVNAAESYIQRTALVHYSPSVIRQQYGAYTGDSFHMSVNASRGHEIRNSNGSTIGYETDPILECEAGDFKFCIDRRIYEAIMDYLGPDFFGFMWWLDHHGLVPQEYADIDWLLTVNRLTEFIQREDFEFRFPVTKIFPDGPVAHRHTSRGMEPLTPDYIEFQKQGQTKMIRYMSVNQGRGTYSFEMLCNSLQLDFGSRELHIPVMGRVAWERTPGSSISFMEVDEAGDYLDASRFVTYGDLINAVHSATFERKPKPKPKYPLIPTKFLEGIDL